jgi:hypothetical protein
MRILEQGRPTSVCDSCLAGAVEDYALPRTTWRTRRSSTFPVLEDPLQLLSLDIGVGVWVIGYLRGLDRDLYRQRGHQRRGSSSEGNHEEFLCRGFLLHLRADIRDCHGVYSARKILHRISSQNCVLLTLCAVWFSTSE